MHFCSYSFRFVQPARLVLGLCVLSVLCVNISSQDWKTVADGVEYAEVRREFSGKPVNINLLRLDLTRVRLDVHHAMDAAIGTERTSSIATRHGAFAAINAGFFRLDGSNWAGDSVGILKIDRASMSEPSQNRIAVFIDNRRDETLVAFEHLKTSSWVEVKKLILTIDGTNRERRNDELIEYNRTFNSTTLTSPDGLEMVIRDGRISEIRNGVGSSSIPPSGYILSASGRRKEQVVEWITKGWLKVGMKVSGFTSVDVGGPQMERTVPYGFEDITNGVPQLIRNGKTDITWEQEKASKSFVETRHPRTAVAKLKDGKFLMLTADGRSDVSAGLDLYDLAKYMLELGAVDAMNLDGGGSTTMFLDGKVVNKPSDKEGERKIGDAILVTLRKPKRR